VIALFVDLVVAALLLATLSYCILLNRRLAALRDDKGELRELIGGLAAASQRAEASVAALRAAAEQVGVGLQEEIDRARALRDDIAFLLERGGSLADRLEGAIRHGREETRAAPAASSPQPARPAPASRASTRAEPRPPAPRVEPQPPAAEPAPRAAEPARSAAPSRVASFPSRIERDLRRVLEGRR